MSDTHRLQRRSILSGLLAILVAAGALMAATALARVTPERNQAAASPTPPGFPDCNATSRGTVHPDPKFDPTKPWRVNSPADDTTYDATIDEQSVISEAFPSSDSPFSLGDGNPGARTCFTNGELKGHGDDTLTWQDYHRLYNAACLRAIATDWLEVKDLHCDYIEDGLRPREEAYPSCDPNHPEDHPNDPNCTGNNANNANMYVSGTYFTNVRDDCLENDGTIGGVLYDNLWEECHTGISERPSKNQLDAWSNGCDEVQDPSCHDRWPSPEGETLTLDHMLIGLYQALIHDPTLPPPGNIPGENALFKWSASANHLKIECSIFLVDARSVNGFGAMAFPKDTEVDDSGCPGFQSTIVWLGGKPGDPNYPHYPAFFPKEKMRDTTDRSVWDSAVIAWKCRHAIPTIGCGAR